MCAVGIQTVSRTAAFLNVIKPWLVFYTEMKTILLPLVRFIVGRGKWRILMLTVLQEMAFIPHRAGVKARGVWCCYSVTQILRFSPWEVLLWVHHPFPVPRLLFAVPGSNSPGCSKSLLTYTIEYILLEKLMSHQNPVNTSNSENLQSASEQFPCNCR